MSHDDFADRTLPPTERRRREARARGEVARSGELTAAAVLLAASCCAWWTAPAASQNFSTLIRHTLSQQPPARFDVSSAVAALQFSVTSLATIVAPFLLILMTCAALANLVQTGWLWMPSAVTPRLRTSSIFSWNRVTESGLRIVKFTVLAAVTIWYLQSRLWQVRSAIEFPATSMLSLVSTMFGELCLRLSICLVVLASVDYGIRYWRQEQALKMTAEERRREQREDEIDPRLKQNRGSRSAATPVRTSPAEIQAVSSVD